MTYNRSRMPMPGGQQYGEPPAYQESLSNPPPVPPRLGLRNPPSLPPRVPIVRELDIATRNMSNVKIDGNVNFDDVFRPDPPPDIFKASNHELNLPRNVDNKEMPVETNKFYGNMMVGSQTNPVWTHPYSLWWAKDSPHMGIAVAHIQASQRVFGPGSPPQYFFNPIGIKSLVFSSTDYTTADDFSLGFASLTHMSAQVFLRKNNDQYIRFPLVQGMGLITAIYHNLVPKLCTAVGIKSFQKVTSGNEQIKYKLLLENNVVWLLYVIVPGGCNIEITMQDANTLVGSASLDQCTMQIVANDAKDIDIAAGCYPIHCELDCSTEGDIGKYQFRYLTEGKSVCGKTLMFAFPHHVSNFTDEMHSQPIVCQLDSTIKGVMNSYLTDSFEMKVSIPKSLGFSPFTTISGKGNGVRYSSDVLEAVKKAASSEVNLDVSTESNLDSMYFSGKILAKYAWILYCCQYIIKEKDLVDCLLPKLKSAISRFADNHQVLPLKYDKTWGGIISSGTSSQDFGNSFYNDHHFHYSYHVIAAAIITKVDHDAGDNAWLLQNRAWVEALIRDYANPSEKDRFFPVFRSFDWFNGHSFAKGLFESGDGKDQESSSEDVNASYALKLWGLATENQPLIDIADIQLGILRTSVNMYFLYSDDNTVMPSAFIRNKVSGILFENKIDHTTYFGNELQYIQMIHAIPITPASSFVRTPKFVEEEWREKLSPIVNDIKDGWQGIIMLNAALFDPRISFNYFNTPEVFLDNGQSLTWSLAYSGAFL
ncbi:hypothetical protein HG535_0F03960 [Zygotorulaspora mrakii]|uniref:glucan endo-1,3-beta-D-glucosidase n=1 Tax=Zygotorulaspora mrakii TaxID=42260 RepID=A0A7H9B6E3_ZYGMR|nr:uncharacterized protein HG535_0F03960 [Zygotorulaspora mrakii]QLG73884.1 hypothetical protein HG535_0F03960 [Zygotorulaspora mrakii]